MLLLKATLVLALAALAGMALHRSAAAVRHRLWSWTFAALLALPLLVATLPRLNLPVSDAISSALSVSAGADVTLPTLASAAPSNPFPAGEAPAAPTPSQDSPSRRFTPREVLTGLWLTGSLLSLIALAISVWRVYRLSHVATRIDDPEWSEAMASIARRLALRAPVRVLISSRVVTPMAGGLLRPTVFLPSNAVAWNTEWRDVVLAHELAHLAARDPQRHLLARVALSFYWFHPLAWFAARQATAAREAACDERVLSLGTRPSAYARVLLDLADSMPAPPRALATLPIVHKSSLEVRVMAILNGSVRPTSGLRGTVAVLGLTFGTLVVAAAAPRETQRETSVREVEDLRQVLLAVGDEDLRGTLRAMRAAIDTFKELADMVPSMPIDAAAQPVKGPQSAWSATACAAGHGKEDFSGTVSMSARNVIFEQTDTPNPTHRMVLFTLDGVRLCMFGENLGPAESDDLPSKWIGKGRRVVMQSSGGGATQRLVIDNRQSTWQVNGVLRPVDRLATEWRERMLAMFDAQWELTSLHGQVTSLRGEITSVRGEETSLRGQITSLRGEVTSMRGRITSLRGEETSMRGRITSIRGHETSLRGQITSARGAITSLQGSGYRPSDAERRIAEYERQIDLIEREIRDYNADAKVAAIEKEISQFDVDRKVAEIEKEIDEFALDKKVAEIERRIAELKVDEREKDLEREIDKIDVENRAAEIRRRIDAERPRLKAAIAALR